MGPRIGFDRGQASLVARTWRIGVPRLGFEASYAYPHRVEITTPNGGVEVKRIYDWVFISRVAALGVALVMAMRRRQ